MSSFTIYHRLLTRVTRQVPLVEQALLTFPELGGIYDLHETSACVANIKSIDFNHTCKIKHV
jgi:hypothetical protein